VDVQDIVHSLCFLKSCFLEGWLGADILKSVGLNSNPGFTTSCLCALWQIT
jgi:hypothetical protein